ncbi:peptidogalycan biosysnthesis protein [uncultured Polaribacter sp.]|uniref:peptidogalycan biosysnthesis protein n=1 Tax=uncultured Polaribacter sp. TaxID=174711 RepID=UPI002635989C|nr:peptidogalycan biosysnthesis protein [uncultured Polaribacter sp.]
MLCKNINTSLFYNSIDEIPAKIWENLDCSGTIYFNPLFLKAIEKNHPKIKFAYIILVNENDNAIAFSSLQIVDFYLQSIQNDFEFIKNIGTKLHLLKEHKPLKLLISGNTFVSGEHGLFIHKNEDKPKVMTALGEAINYFINSNRDLKNSVDAFLIKDFVQESLIITNELKQFNYNPFSVEPNMHLNINTDWLQFDDYLNALKTKFRVKAKKAFQLSKSLKIKEITIENIEAQIPEITKLYNKVVDQADFNLSKFNVETYVDFKKHLKENYILKTFYLEDKMVGFLSGIINKNELDAHFVGIDYDLNRTHAIYQRMLYEYIDIAISKKLKIINFGRTASEIKSSVGATPQNLTIYLRHKKTITNKILKLFLQKVQPTPFQQKFPFKKIK